MPTTVGNLSGQNPRLSVRDTTTGAFLYERDAAAPFAFAGSTVKLMTALLAAETFAADLDTPVVVTGADTANPLPGLTLSNAGLAPGETWTVRQLLAGALIPSGCDAAMCLARVVGDLLSPGGGVPRFVQAMNARAAAMGMTGSTFTDPYGRSHMTGQDFNVVTADDLMTLGTAATAIPVVRDLAVLPQFVAVLPNRSVPLVNFNRFVNGPVSGAQTGVKTAGADVGKNGVWVLDGLSNYSLFQIWAVGGRPYAVVTLGNQDLMGMTVDHMHVAREILASLPPSGDVLAERERCAGLVDAYRPTFKVAAALGGPASVDFNVTPDGPVLAPLAALIRG